MPCHRFHRASLALVALVMAPGACASSEGEASTGDSTGSSTSDSNAEDPTLTASTTTPSTTSDSSGGSVGTDDSSTTPGTESTGGDASTSTDPTVADSTETGDVDCVPVIAEIFYDADAPSDDALQWIKVKNPCSFEIDLSTWSLGYARGEAGDIDFYTGGTKGFLALPATVAAGDCFIVGGPTTDANNGNPDYDYPEDFAPGIFAPDTVGAAVALFDVVVIDLASVPRDAVVYGPNNDNAYIDETGQPVAAPHIGGSAVGGSLRRTSLAATWETAAVPTPNDCPRF